MDMKIFIYQLKEAIEHKQKEKIKSLIDKISDLGYMKTVINLLSPDEHLYLKFLKIPKFDEADAIASSKSFETRNRKDPEHQLAELFKENEIEHKATINDLNERIKTLTEEVKNQNKIEDKIQKFLSEFSDEAESNLLKRQEKYHERSICFLLSGGAAIIISIGISFLYMLHDFSEGIVNNELSRNLLIYITIKGVFLIAAILYMAKISFFYATAYTSESIKCENRLHAIRFGKTYLNIFGSQIEKNEVMKAFENWNISSESDFSTPKGKENIRGLIDEIKTL